MDIYRHFFENAPDALLAVDHDGHITRVNARVQSLLGFTPDELIGRTVEVLVPEKTAARHVGYRKRFAADPKTRHMGASLMSVFARHRSGSEIPVDIMISTLETDDGTTFLCALRDVTERKAAVEELRRRTSELEQLHAQLKELASHDSLTGLLNRRAFQEQAEWILRNSLRQQQSMSLLMIDLDFFKHVNDEFGHTEGDRVLFNVANTLKATCRQNDVPARYGGEEFAVALPDTDHAGSSVVAENFRAAIENIKDQKEPITASIGVVTFEPENDSSLSTSRLFGNLVNAADEALYAAKHNGRNRVAHANAMPTIAALA